MMRRQEPKQAALTTEIDWEKADNEKESQDRK